jgi:hypothetical protein
MENCETCNTKLTYKQKRFCRPKCKHIWQKGKPAHNKLLLDEKLIVDYYNIGLTMKDISIKFNVSTPTINKIIKKYGISRPSGFGNKENNTAWKGGILKLSRALRGIPEYKEWRKRIFEKYGYKCRICKHTKIEAHHIKPYSELLKHFNIKSVDQALNCNELWDIDNGICLCNPHHKEVHKK